MEDQETQTSTGRQLLAVPSTDLFDDLAETIEAIASKYEGGPQSPGRAIRVSDRRRRMGGNRAQAVLAEIRRRHAASVKDSKRLEWLARNRTIPNEKATYPFIEPDDLRHAIDAELSPSNVKARDAANDSH